MFFQSCSALRSGHDIPNLLGLLLVVPDHIIPFLSAVVDTQVLGIVLLVLPGAPTAEPNR